MSFWKRKKAERLTKKGYQLIGDDEWDEALRVAEKLNELRYSAGFEIQALALEGKGDIEAAVAALEQGVEQAPQVWLNWQLLGNYRSNLGRYAEAADAYSKGLCCPDAWEGSLRLNQAVLVNRTGRPTEAIEILRSVSDPELSLAVTTTRLSAWNAMGKQEEARSEGLRILDELNDEDPTGLDGVAFEVFSARLGLEEDRASLKEWAASWAVLHAPASRTLAAIRELDDLRSPRGRYFRLLIEAQFGEAEVVDRGVLGFFTSVDVVADSPDEALELYRPFAEAFALTSLKTTECEELEARPDGYQGVFKLTPLMYFQGE